MEEKIFILRDHMEDHIIWINDLLIVLKILENGFEYEPGDKKNQEVSCIRLLFKLIQGSLSDLQNDYDLIVSLVNQCLEGSN